MIQPVRALHVGQPPRVVNGRVDDLLQLTQRLPHDMDVWDFQKDQLHVWVGAFTFVATAFGLETRIVSKQFKQTCKKPLQPFKKESSAVLEQLCGMTGECSARTNATLFVSATLFCLASKMKSLWDWALASMMVCRYFSSSLQRLSLGPTRGWLQRVMVAWLSGWIQDNTWVKKQRTGQCKKDSLWSNLPAELKVGHKPESCCFGFTGC